MIQVLERAAAIISLIASDKQKSWPLCEIADTLEVNRGTCANIIKTLLEVGYLEKMESPKGYTLGLELYKIASNGKSTSNLLDFAFEDINNLAEEINESTILSTIRNGRRILLHQVNCTHEIQVRSQDNANVYKTTTGKMIRPLLACTV